MADYTDDEKVVVVLTRGEHAKIVALLRYNAHFSLAKSLDENRSVSTLQYNIDDAICPVCHNINHMEYHGKPCSYCGDAVNNLAASPSQWSLLYPDFDGTGVVKPHHVGCVMERLVLAETVLEEQRKDKQFNTKRDALLVKQKACAHTKFVSDDPISQREYQCSSPVCVACGFFGASWYCPMSTNGLCEFNDESEYCIHCGQPDERK